MTEPGLAEAGPGQVNDASLVDAIHCLHARECGGCALIERSYTEQLRLKRQLLSGALAGYAELVGLEVCEPLPTTATTAYRLRAKLVVSGKRVGLFRRNTHQVVDIPHCRVLRPRVLRAMAALREALPFAFELLAVDAREVDAGVLLSLVVPPATLLEAVRAVAQGLNRLDPEIIGVSLSYRRRDAATLLGSPPRPIWGVAEAAHHLHPGEPWHNARSGAFVQAHAEQASRLHELVEARLLQVLHDFKGRRIVDLYAGAGALALRLAARGARVLAIDGYGPGLEGLASAARAQRIEIETRVALAERVLLEPLAADAVVVNPPELGLSSQVRERLARLRPRCIVYVSCGPRSLSRDLWHFLRLGYAARELAPVDLIPLSEAVETVALLEPREPSAPHIIYQDELCLVADKPPFLSTIPQGEYSDSLLANLRRLPGAEQAVPVHRLDRATSGVCLFAREPRHAERLGRALRQGSKEYWALCRGIVHAKGIVRRKLRDGPSSREAVTRYRRLRLVGTHSLLAIAPETGRKHQIRRHFAGIGHPLLGDDRYGDARSNQYFEKRHGLDRVFLHCARIRLAGLGSTPEWSSELPPDLVAVLTSLEAG